MDFLIHIQYIYIYVIENIYTLYIIMFTTVIFLVDTQYYHVFCTSSPFQICSEASL